MISLTIWIANTKLPGNRIFIEVVFESHFIEAYIAVLVYLILWSGVFSSQVEEELLHIPVEQGSLQNKWKVILK